MEQEGVRVCFTFDVDGLSLLGAKRRVGIRIPLEMDAHLRDDQGHFFDLALAFLNSAGLRQTLFVTGKVAEDEPERIAAALQAGHEIGFHGYSHLPLASLSAEGEQAEFLRTQRYFHDRFGYQLKGMRAPSYSFGPRTPGNMRLTGMTYDSSQAGCHPFFETDGGYWEIPVLPEMDDWMHCIRFPELGFNDTPKDPEEVARIYRNCFDHCYREGGCFVTVWHPFVTMSERYRSVATELLAYIRSHARVTFCTMSEIAEACAAGRITQGRI